MSAECLSFLAFCRDCCEGEAVWRSGVRATGVRGDQGRDFAATRLCVVDLK